MMLSWLDARAAAQAGVALADGFVLDSASAPDRGQRKDQGERTKLELQKFLQKFLQRVDRDTRPLKLNLFKRAKLANSFKWRLLEKGVEQELVDELTQALVLRLTRGAGHGMPPERSEAPASKNKLKAKARQSLHEQGGAYLNQGAWQQALTCYEELLRVDPRDAFAHNGMGFALARLDRYPQAQDHLRRAIAIREDFPEAQFNLAGVLLSIGHYLEAERPLRRALKLKADFLDARVALAGNLVLLGRLPEARDSYTKALRVAPTHAAALVGLGKLEAAEGNFPEAQQLFQRAVEADPGASYAWAAQVWQRKMSTADSGWLKRAEEIAASGLPPLDESTLRFAIGKYYDDVGDFTRAFRNYQRANEMHRTSASTYKPESHAHFVDDLIGVYTREALQRGAAAGSASERPVFVVGMPRSGTSLVEQIIASHSSAYGAGELEFWTDVVHKSDNSMCQALPEESARKRLAQDYLRLLERHSSGAARVVDKAPINADYLGLIHTVFPRARIVYLQRDPIDTCLSCYFQQFSPVMNFAMDLDDLALYYRQHRRLMTHWREVLPAGTLLGVPYAELVQDPELWTRRILDFIGLPFEPGCLNFQETRRTITTASTWQVRQKIYKSSVERWRNYEKFIKPLLSLRDLSP
jgi:tetratricopeptide (TPR) repeat protein